MSFTESAGHLRSANRIAGRDFLRIQHGTNEECARVRRGNRDDDHFRALSLLSG